MMGRMAEHHPAKYPTVTLLTVSYGHGALLAHQRHLLAATHPSHCPPWQWLVMENKPDALDETRRLLADDPHIRVLPGINAGDLQTQFPPAALRQAPASYHHGAALNALYQHAVQSNASETLLVLDPDFFIIYPNWLAELPHWMAKTRTAILGTPWHPAHAGKWRHFPNAHCVFLQQALLGTLTIDFLPGFHTAPKANDWRKQQRRLAPWPWRLADHLSGGRLLAQRLMIGTSRDTGFGLKAAWDALENRPKMALFEPVYTPAEAPNASNPFSRLGDFLLPEALSYQPKQAYPSAVFHEADLAIIDGNGWERFWWQGRPWGFHLRGFQQSYDMRRFSTAMAGVETWLRKQAG